MVRPGLQGPPPGVPNLALGLFWEQGAVLLSSGGPDHTAIRVGAEGRTSARGAEGAKAVGLLGPDPTVWLSPEAAPFPYPRPRLGQRSFRVSPLA